uniref:Uncharacterized protein n=1 Tax=Anguilla anguilla TaxID=7936 RepID=A0A0E9VS01_ANGAN
MHGVTRDSGHRYQGKARWMFVNIKACLIPAALLSLEFS